LITTTGISTAGITSARAVDWDDDGILDVMVGKKQAGFVLLRGQGNGIFTIPSGLNASSTVSIFPSWLTPNPTTNLFSFPVFVDLNGDGLPDLVNAGYENSLNSSVGVSYNTSF